MKSALVGNVHLIAGGADALASVLALLGQEGIQVRGNSDVYVRQYARFGADDARELQERAALRPAAGGRRAFVVATPTMTTEAQNVLLKTLEEPPADALFFFIVPAPQALLPTLRSRAQILTLEGSGAVELVDAKKFLASSPDKRLEMLKPLLEKDEDDKRDLRPVLAFLGGLEARLTKKPDGLQAVYRARKYATDKGALLKPLLEQVALLTPVLK
jgi:hypothetical protein